MWLPLLFRPETTQPLAEPTQPPVPLTEDGWRVFNAAVHAAHRNRHEYIGTEHLLVGITEAGPTPAAEALELAGITPMAIRQQCRFDPGLGLVTGALVFTPTTRRVFESALHDAEQSGAAQVGSLGLLLALAREEEGVAWELLASVVTAEADHSATQ